MNLYRQLAILAAIVLAVSGCKNDQKVIPASTASEAQVAEVGGYEIRSTNKPVVAGELTSAEQADTFTSPKPARIVPPRFPKVLPSEKTLLEGDAVSVQSAAKVLKSADFGDFVENLAEESAKDPIAQDMEKLQRGALEQRIAKLKAGQLQSLACGLSVCVGSIDLGDNLEASKRFSADFVNNPSSVAFSLIDHQYKISDDHYEKRFVISVDPGVRGLTVPREGPAGG